MSVSYESLLVTAVAETPQEPAVTLRPLSPDDAADLYGLVDRNRPELSKFWWERQTHSPEDSRSFIDAVNRSEATNGAPTRGIYVDEGLVGVAALHKVDWETRSGLLGYWIDRDQYGKGIATEAAGQLVRVAFDELSLEDLRITARTNNLGSLAVARKLGFSLESVHDQPVWNPEERAETATYVLHGDDFYARHAVPLTQTDASS